MSRVDSVLWKSLSRLLSDDSLNFIGTTENVEASTFAIVEANNTFMAELEKFKKTSNSFPTYFDNKSPTLPLASVYTARISEDYWYIAAEAKRTAAGTDGLSGWAHYHCLVDNDGKVAAPCFGVSHKTAEEIGATTIKSLMQTKSRKKSVVESLNERFQSFAEEVDALTDVSIPTNMFDMYDYLEAIDLSCTQLELDWNRHIFDGISTELEVTERGYSALEVDSDKFANDVDAGFVGYDIPVSDRLSMRTGGMLIEHLRHLTPQSQQVTVLRNLAVKWVEEVNEAIKHQVRDRETQDLLGDEWGSW